MDGLVFLQQIASLASSTGPSISSATRPSLSSKNVDGLPSHERQLGKLSLNLKTTLGHGSHGTVHLHHNVLIALLPTTLLFDLYTDSSNRHCGFQRSL